MSVTIRRAGPDAEALPLVVGGREAAPAEWQAWAEEPGHDLAAVDAGRTVGGIHVSIVGRTEAWIEALRVHPDAQGRGIAGHLVKEAEGVARHYGVSVLRTAVPAHDYSAVAVAERAGYRSVGRCAVVEMAVPAGPAHVPYDAPIEEPRTEQVPAVLRFLERTQTLAAWDRLVPIGWRFRRLIPELVRGLIKDGRVASALAQGRSEEPQAAALHTWHDDAIVIGLIDGAPPGMQAVFGDLIERAQERRIHRLVVFTPSSALLEPLGVHEWRAHPFCPDGLVIVQKSLAS